MAGGIQTTGIAVWTGASWEALGMGTDHARGVTALCRNGADLYAGGNFFQMGGIDAHGVAKWNGTNWFGLGSGLIGGSPLALASNGSEVFAGGGFYLAGSKPSTNIALWHIPHALSANVSGNALTLSWPATGSNFVLEANTALVQSNWAAVSPLPVVLGNQLVVTNEISSGEKFYRLRRR